MLILQRNLMEPPRQYMAHQFARAGQAWEVKQRAKVARTSEAGRRLGGAREYRVTEIAGGQHDKTFMYQLHLLYHEKELWSCLPPKASHTVHFRSLCFRAITRMGCLFEELLASEHRKMH